MRLEAVDGHGLLPLADLQPENLRAGGEDSVWAAVERRQGKDGAALADIDERRLEEGRRRLGRHLRV
jgi:hypothetical protein